MPASGYESGDEFAEDHTIHQSRDARVRRTYESRDGTISELSKSARPRDGRTGGRTAWLFSARNSDSHGQRLAQAAWTSSPKRSEVLPDRSHERAAPG